MLWTIGCGGASGPVGPVVEHHVVERGTAMSARVDIDMTHVSQGVQHPIGDLKLIAE